MFYSWQQVNLSDHFTQKWLFSQVWHQNWIRATRWKWRALNIWAASDVERSSLSVCQTTQMILSHLHSCSHTPFINICVCLIVFVCLHSNLFTDEEIQCKPLEDLLRFEVISSDFSKFNVEKKRTEKDEYCKERWAEVSLFYRDLQVFIKCSRRG